MAEEKVLTNPDLLTIILSFTGVKIKRKCNICGMVLKYQILNQEIEYDHKSYINFELCKKVYLCSEDCLHMYKKLSNNERCCLMTTLLCTSVCLLLCVVLFLLQITELPTININLSV